MPLPFFLLTLPSTWFVLGFILFLYLLFRVIGFFNDLKKIDSRYAFTRKRAAEKLAQDSSPESVTTLAYAVASSKDQTVIKIAVSALSRLLSQESIDALYKVWEETKHKDITAILKKRRYVATEINLQVLFALKIGTVDILKEKTEDILEILLSAIDDRDTQIASAASNCIATLTNRKTIDTICRQWIEYPNPRLQAIIQQGNYEPNDASIKALFYFLLGEWKKYEDLDFDQSLLARAYQSASKEIQTRIGEKAKTGGRIEWFKILTNNKHGYDIKKITEKDWEAFIDILESQPDRKEIWRFLYNAPAIWSKKLLDKLVKSSANWLVKDDEIRLNKLFKMAENLREQDFILFKSSEDQDLDFLISSELQEVSPRIIQGYYFVEFLDEYTFASTKSSSRVDEIEEVFLQNLPYGNHLGTINRHQNYINHTYRAKSFQSLEISPDGKVLAVVIKQKSEDGSLPHHIACLSSLPNEERLVDITGYGLETRLNISLIKINTKQKIVVSAYDRNIHFWSLSNGKLLKVITTKTYIKLIEISSDGCILATSDGISTTLWSLPDGNLLKTFQIGGDLAISPDGKVLANYTYGYRSSPFTDEVTFQLSGISLWSLSDGNHLASLNGHTDYVCSVAISQNGKILASGSQDGTIRLWSLPDGKHLKTLKVHSNTGGCTVKISQNGRILVSNSSDGNMRIWTSPHSPISKLTPRDIAEIERKTRDSNLEEGTRNAFKFTLALIRLRQEFDIDIEKSSNNIASSEFDIEIEG